MSKLERAVYVLLILVCLVSLGVLVKNGFFGPAGTEPSEDSLVGKVGPSLPGTAWSDSDLNVVLLLDSHCRFCQESMPLYKKLSEMHRRNRKRFSLLVVGQEYPERLSAYLKENSVEPERVSQAPYGFAGVKSTPAIFVLDSRGVIQRAYLGKLDWIRRTRLLIGLV